MLPKPEEHCKNCVLFEFPFGKRSGFSELEIGPKAGGVLLVGEALGEDEEASGLPFIGKSGQFLFSSLQRVGIERDELMIANVLACRPPNNKLVGMPYEHKCIAHCAPLLDSRIETARSIAKSNAKTFVIVTLGKTAFKRIMGFSDRDPVMRNDYLAYPFWHHTYQAWVLAADHPAYLVRGNQHLQSVLQWTVKRAVEIAESGLELQKPNYLLDPTPQEFSVWVDEAIAQSNIISYDIETPFKQGSDEEEVSKTDDEDYTILRCSASYKAGTGCSAPWRAEYLADWRRLFASDNPKVGWNNCPTPDMRLLTADLRWEQVGHLVVGDELVGFDETVVSGKFRKYRKTIITKLERSIAPVFAVTLSDGTIIKTTGEHPWLIKNGKYQWVPTAALKTGQAIRRQINPWTVTQSYNTGWLAGFFNGEGSFSTSNGALKVAAAQVLGDTYDECKIRMEAAGYTTGSKRNNKSARTSHIGEITVNGGMSETLRFLGSVRPSRLLKKFKVEQMGSVWAWTDDLVIESVSSLGEQEIIHIETDAHTYILEGFGAHNCNYDDPRIQRYAPINGDSIDAMLAWHVLNSALPKGLGFVTPFYAKNASMWKHLSNSEPAFYNAKDADMALQIWLGVEKDLKENKLWDVFDRHVVGINRIFSYMSSQGVLMDLEARDEAEKKVSKLLNESQERMEQCIPVEARALKVFKKVPKSTEDMIQVRGTKRTTKCPSCGLHDVKAPHYKSIGKKRIAKGEVDNPCVGLKSEKVVVSSLLWAKPLEFKISPISLLRYQQAKGHQAISVPDRDSTTRTRRTTFDEKAILKLTKKYPKDPLYPIILEFRGLQKLLSTYIGVRHNGTVMGGMPVMPSGKVHTSFTHNPSTLRSASQNPNLQNLPRPQGKDDPATLIRNFFVASPGNILLARDFSGIEAVLTGYFANAPNYVRLAKRDVHTFYTAYAIHHQEPGRIPANDLPLLSWDDDKLFGRLAELKVELKHDRNNLYKHLVHAANFGQGAKGASDTILRMSGKEVSAYKIGQVMGIYYDLFPEIKTWHGTLLAQVDRDGFLRNPFGYVHRFFRPYEWEYRDGKWEKGPGADANRVYAFLPQSTAAGIIKDAMLRMWNDHYEGVARYLRLLIHDELFFDVPESEADGVDETVKLIMEAPITCMKLPWDADNYMTIETEAKRGPRWGEMR